MSKTETAQIKAVALLVMFWYHLFATDGYMVLPENVWSSILSEQFVVTVAKTGGYSLFLFLFCSGYGLYFSGVSRRMSIRDWLARFLRILIPYWLIMAVTIAYLAARGRFQPGYLAVNLFALHHDDNVLYVSFSWFIKVYLEMLLLLPLFGLLNRKIGRKPMLEAALCLVLPWLLQLAADVAVQRLRSHFTAAYLAYTVFEACYYLPHFLLGLLCAKYGILEAAWQRLKKWRPALLAALAAAAFAGVIALRTVKGEMQFTLLDWVQTLLLALSILSLSRISPVRNPRVLPYLGNHSLYYWLLSGFFFLNTSELQFLLFLPRYSLLILIWQVLLETPFVFVFQKAGKALTDGALKLIYSK